MGKFSIREALGRIPIVNKLPVKIGAPSSAARDYLVADFTDEYLKVALVQEAKGSVRLLNCAVKERGESSEDDIANFLRESMIAFGTRTQEIFCVVPSKHFISRNIDMPSNNKEEIAKIINLQVGRFTPYSREEIVVDYLCREMVGQHYTNVLLIIVHRKVVEGYFRIAEKIGLSVETVCIASEALSRRYDGYTDESSGIKTLGGIHISEYSTDLTVVEESQMVFVRSIPLGWKDISKRQTETDAGFVSEINKSLAAYQDEGVGQAINLFLVSGILVDIDNVIDKVRQEVSMIAEASGGLKKLEYREEFSMTSECEAAVQVNRDISFFEAFAVGIHTRGLQLNAMPQEMKLKKNVRQGGREAITTGVLIMTLFLMLSFLLTSKVFFKKAQLAELDEVNQSTFERSRSLERISTKTRAVRKLLENRGRGLYVFDKITALIGEDIYLTNFSYDTEDDSLNISGTAESMSRIFAFVTQLEESNYFESVTTQETQSRREGKKEVADFSIDCVLAEGF